MSRGEAPPGPVAVALGSNRGDRWELLRYGLRELERLLRSVRTSRVYRSEPAEGAGGGPFLNMCVAGRLPADGPRTAHELLRHLRYVEMGAGRPPRRGPGDPRTLDLDLLLVGDVQVNDDELTLPHPRMTGRSFVLTPLDELLPEWRHPASGETVSRLAARAGHAGIEPAARDEFF